MANATITKTGTVKDMVDDLKRNGVEIEENGGEVNDQMKMSNYQMDEAITVLRSIHESGRLGYAIARNLRKLEDAAKEYLDIKMNALQKFGDKINEKDGLITFQIPNSKSEEYLNELGDIPYIEHEVEIFTIPEDVFYGGSLTSDQMSKLLWMVE